MDRHDRRFAAGEDRMKLQDFIERAKRGENVFMAELRAAFSHLPGVVCTLELTAGGERRFTIPLPKAQSEEERAFLREYFYGNIYNILSVLGGKSMRLYAQTQEARELCKSLPRVFETDKPRGARRGYGKCLTVTDRMNAAMGCASFAFTLEDTPLPQAENEARHNGASAVSALRAAAARAHILVSLGAATVMIVSKYGFFDMSALSESGFFRVDPARIGSTILTGIGFLGAGVILQRGGAVRGLTTAAGVWVTGGVGMAIGAGMYVLGIACTLLVVFVQIALKRLAWRAAIDDHPDNAVTMTLCDDTQIVQDFLKWLGDKLPHARLSHMERKKGKVMITILVCERDYKTVADVLAEREELESITM